jgi:hypothetical protein
MVLRQRRRGEQARDRDGAGNGKRESCEFSTGHDQPPELTALGVSRRRE